MWKNYSPWRMNGSKMGCLAPYQSPIEWADGRPNVFVGPNEIVNINLVSFPPPKHNSSDSRPGWLMRHGRCPLSSSILRTSSRHRQKTQLCDPKLGRPCRLSRLVMSSPLWQRLQYKHFRRSSPQWYGVISKICLPWPGSRICWISTLSTVNPLS